MVIYISFIYFFVLGCFTILYQDYDNLVLYIFLAKTKKNRARTEQEKAGKEKEALLRGYET